MKKRIIILLIIIMISMSVLTGCGQSENKENYEESMTENSGDIIEITDMAGRDISLEGPIDKVVVIGSALRIYTYVNGTEKLVGVEKKQQSTETGRPYIIANPELEKLPIVGEGFPANPDPELLIEADPDIIIAGDLSDVAEIEELEKKIGIPIIIVTCGESTIFDEDMYKSLKIIGEVIGNEGRAEELIEFMENCKDELIDLTKDIPENEKPSIYLGGLSHKGNHGIESTVGNSPILNSINAKNVADEIGKSNSIMIDREKLIEWDPDILVIDENGLPLVKEDYEKNPEYYSELTAVRNGNVYAQLPCTSYYKNIETAMANMYFLGKVLYPDEFQDIDPIEKADEIYTFMLGETLYDTMAKKFGGYIEIDLKN